MTVLRIFPAPGHDNELIFIIIPPWVPVPSSQPYACLTYIGVKSEKSSILLSLFSKYVLLSLCTVSVGTRWGEDEWNGPKHGRGTDDSRVIMTTRQAAQGLLRLPASHSSRGRHKGCFVSITLPGQHLGELNLSGQGGARRRTCRRTTCPFPLTFTHTAAHHAYSDATTNIYPTTIKTLILCHPTCKSSPWGYVQLVYTLSRDICEHR